MVWCKVILPLLLALSQAKCDDLSDDGGDNEVDPKNDFRKGRASEGDITDISRKITLNENNLPGITRPDGKKCVEKIFNVEETEFDHGLDCVHRLKEKCHLTYVTDYHSAPEEKCETIFKKKCHISFVPVPHVEKVKKCITPYQKKCGDDIKGPEICKTVYETLCETLYKEYEIEEDEPDCKTEEQLRCKKVPFEILHLPHKEGQAPYAEKERCEKWPVQKCEVNKKTNKKLHPDTQCKKVARKVCAPKGCEIVPGPEICTDEERTLVHNVPKEECDIQPINHCKTKATLVPKLVPKKNCVKVPKEICFRTRKDPKKRFRPIKKNWCYDPDELKKNIVD